MAKNKETRRLNITMVLDEDDVSWLDKKGQEIDFSRSQVARMVFRTAREAEVLGKSDLSRDQILDEIGEDYVKEYFGLVTPEDLEAR